MSAIETANKFFVAANSQGVVIMKPPTQPMSREDCLLLAAWLVAMAPVAAPDGDMQDVDDQFFKVLEAVQNT